MVAGSSRLVPVAFVFDLVGLGEADAGLHDIGIITPSDVSMLATSAELACKLLV